MQPTERHLTAVHAAPVQIPLSPDAEEALGRAFDASRHRLSDAKSVERVAGRLPTDGLSSVEMERLLRSLLDAAVKLRERSETVTAESLLVETFAAKYGGEK